MSFERRRRTGRLWLGLAILGLQGCSLHSVETAVGVGANIDGEVTVRGGQAGDVVLRPQSCLSGDRANFRGVDVIAPPLVLRLAAEPIDGLAVALIDVESGERRGIFRRPDCQMLRGDVQRTGWQINDVFDVTGFVELDCKAPTGEEISGSIRFTHCH